MFPLLPTHPHALFASPYARPNLFLGIALTKTQRHAKAVGKATKARSQYLAARQKALGKGQTVVPEDPAGKAKSEWKSWQKWRGKAGERALKLLEAAEKKGRLDPAQAAALNHDMAAAMIEDPAAVLAAVEAGHLPAEVLQDTLSDPNDVGIPTWALVGGGAVVAVGGLLLLRSFLRR